MQTSVLKVPFDVNAVFKSRPNRFLGIVNIIEDGKLRRKSENVHIHDPGRLKELLYHGNKVFLKHASNPNRKTQWDLIAAKADDQWVFVHSGYHRDIAENILKNPKISPFGKLKSITPEVQIDHSRLDFLLTNSNGKRIYLEVKGCTLTHDGIALFPDAPTERGARHLQTLVTAKTSGDDSALLILIFRQDSQCFAPNKQTDPNFAEAFQVALDHGISVHPLVLSYDGKTIYFINQIPLCPNL